MQEHAPNPLWATVGALERKSLEAWRRSFHPNDALELAFATHARHIESTVARTPGASTLVTISIMGKRGHQSAVEVFELQTAGNKTVKVLSGTLDL